MYIKHLMKILFLLTACSNTKASILNLENGAQLFLEAEEHVSFDSIDNIIKNYEGQERNAKLTNLFRNNAFFRIGIKGYITERCFIGITLPGVRWDAMKYNIEHGFAFLKDMLTVDTKPQLNFLPGYGICKTFLGFSYNRNIEGVLHVNIPSKDIRIGLRPGIILSTSLIDLEILFCDVVKPIKNLFDKKSEEGVGFNLNAGLETQSKDALAELLNVTFTLRLNLVSYS